MRACAACVLPCLALFVNTASPFRTDACSSHEPSKKRSKLVNISLISAPASFSQAPLTEAELSAKFLEFVPIPFTCGDFFYFGEVEGLGEGSDGITVGLKTKNREKVVAKLAKSTSNNIFMNTVKHECAIFKQLQMKLQGDAKKNTLRCLDSCTLMKLQGDAKIHHDMIVVSPWVDKPVKEFEYELPVYNDDGPSFWEGHAAVQRAVQETLRTAWAMLEVGIVNRDQGHNILYGKDGSTVFIDMGMARDLSVKTDAQDLGYASDYDFMHDPLEFISDVLGKVPTSWWRNGNADKILDEVGWPSTPDFVKQRAKQIDNSTADTQGLVTEFEDHIQEEVAKWKIRAPFQGEWKSRDQTYSIRQDRILGDEWEGAELTWADQHLHVTIETESYETDSYKVKVVDGKLKWSDADDSESKVLWVWIRP